MLPCCSMSESGIPASSGLTPLMERLRLLTPQSSSAQAQHDEPASPAPSPRQVLTPLQDRLQRGLALAGQSKGDSSPASSSFQDVKTPLTKKFPSECLAPPPSHAETPLTEKALSEGATPPRGHAETPPTKKPLSDCATPPPVTRKRRLTKESLEELQCELGAKDAKCNAGGEEEPQTFADGVTSAAAASPPVTPVKKRLRRQGS